MTEGELVPRDGGSGDGGDEHDQPGRAWREAAEQMGRFAEALGRSVSSAAGETDRDALKDATKRFGAAVDEVQKAFGRFGEGLRDEQLRDQARGAARSVGDALTVTFEQAGEQLREAVHRERGDRDRGREGDRGEGAQGSSGDPGAPPSR